MKIKLPTVKYLIATPKNILLMKWMLSKWKLKLLFVGYGGIIAAGEVTPILPVAGEKQPENITRFFFEWVGESG